MMRRPTRKRAAIAWLALASLCGISSTAQAAEAQPVESPVSFNSDVAPLLTKLGCNGGGCHGKATGQNGFKLSLLGFEPELDYEAIVRESRGRRLFLASPARSLLLLKATGAWAHGGGMRLSTDSEDYRTLLAWIEQGARPSPPDEPELVRVTVTPERHVFDSSRQPQPLAATAHFSDGSTRDVTRRAVYLSNEPELAEVSDSGQVQVGDRSGSFAVMVRYADEIAVFYGLIPHAAGESEAQTQLAAWEQNAARSFIDRQLAAQWRRLGIAPSPPADDREFIRRASLDICGTLPTVAEATDYA
ncbi:MAG TPA: DUF1549 domain-containing protein, partial [Thermomicrobiales bacterium]|nr:DUF1549 domain-containing protein [Thermomicrobiales bacterium]